MNYIIHLCVFIIVLISYLHVQSHFRTAPGSDVFELDGVIEARIDDVLDLKQPVVFRARTDAAFEEELNIHALLRARPDVDVSVVDSAKGTRVAASLDSFVKLQQTATDTHYYSDGNDIVIQGLSKEARARIAAHHVLLAPPLAYSTRYDLMFGTAGGMSALRRHVAHRSYFTVTNGTVEAKLSHPDQLTNTEFTCSPDAVPDSMTSAAISGQTIPKAKDVTLYKGQTLYVPPYWGVTFQFTKDTFVLVAKYSTYMTEAASCTHAARFWFHKMTARPAVVPDTHVPDTQSDSLNPEEKSCVAEINPVEEVTDPDEVLAKPGCSAREGQAATLAREGQAATLAREGQAATLAREGQAATLAQRTQVVPPTDRLPRLPDTKLEESTMISVSGDDAPTTTPSPYVPSL
jgi:hypothetical protein